MLPLCIIGCPIATIKKPERQLIGIPASQPSNIHAVRGVSLTQPGLSRIQKLAGSSDISFQAMTAAPMAPMYWADSGR